MNLNEIIKIIKILLFDEIRVGVLLLNRRRIFIIYRIDINYEIKNYLKNIDKKCSDNLHKKKKHFFQKKCHTVSIKKPIFEQFKNYQVRTFT